MTFAGTVLTVLAVLCVIALLVLAWGVYRAMTWHLR